MKTLFMVCLCSIALAVNVFGQGPTASPVDASPSPAPTASVSPSGDLADKIQQRLDQKFKKHRAGVTIGDHGTEKLDSGDIPEQVGPIVGMTMLTVCCAPVPVHGL